MTRYMAMKVTYKKRYTPNEVVSMVNADEADSVATRLHTLRIKRGLTIQQMAEMCGLPKRSLENYMRVQSPQQPGLEALLAIADGLNVSLDWLVGRAPEGTSRKLTKDDYALACFCVVELVIGELRRRQSDGRAFDSGNASDSSEADSELAAAAMLDFRRVIDVMEANADTTHEDRRSFRRRMVTTALRQVKAAEADRQP